MTTSLEYVNECGNIQKELYISLIHTFEHCKEPKPKIGKNVPRRGIARPQSSLRVTLTIDLPNLLQEIRGPILEIYKWLTDT